MTLTFITLFNSVCFSYITSGETIAVKFVTDGFFLFLRRFSVKTFDNPDQNTHDASLREDLCHEILYIFFTFVFLCMFYTF